MGSYVISVSLGKGCYRHIQIASSATLYRLHKAILEAYQFDDDHQHAFFMDNRVWSHEAAFFSTKTERGEKTTRQIRLEKLGLKPGDRFKYLFDFGDEWRFQCRVLRQLEENAAEPVIVRSVGDAPEQYPDYEEEWEPSIAVELPERFDEQRIRSLLSGLPLSKETAEELHAYFEAAARLYGVIPVSKLLEVYNSQNEPVSEEVFFAYVDVLRHEENDFFILSRSEVEGRNDPGPEKREVISGYLLEGDAQAYFALISSQGDKPYKLLPKAELLCYADNGSLPLGEQGEAMLRYLCEKQRQLQISPLKACYMMKVMISEGNSFQHIIDSVVGQGLIFHSDADIQEFVTLYQELSNHTRLQANRGYTPAELFAAKEKRPRVFRLNTEPTRLPLDVQPARTPAAPKVGRNDPCPCGSGLKYKKCCGKAQSHPR